MMTRRLNFIPRLACLLGALSLFAGCSSPTAVPAKPAQPNIIFIVLDDMGPFDVGVYGSKAVQTPNIDRLAAEGMRFTQAYSGCTVCAPARSTLMTGMHMGHTSVRGNSGGVPLLDEDVTVAELLKTAGYATGGFGKWGLGDLDTSGVPERQGFDRFVGYYDQVHAHHYYPDYLIDTGRKVPLPGNQGFYDGETGRGAFPDTDPASGRQREFTAYPIFEAMQAFIRENREGPFFCYAPWTPPHGDYELPESDPAWALYKDKPWDVRAKVHAAFCSMMDRHLGETIELLRELGLDENTVVFFTSDNGAASRFEGELDSSGPLKGFKRSMYEGGIRVPFIAWWPGPIEAGSVSDLPVYFPDFLPTAVELAEAVNTAAVDGVSILPELLGARRLDRERPLYWEWHGPKVDPEETPRMQAHRRGRWKIVRHDAGAEWELYDVLADVGERRDRAGEFAEVVAEMAAWVERDRVDPRAQVEPEGAGEQRWR
jgi:arylsulfatase A-like enzyme